MTLNGVTDACEAVAMLAVDVHERASMTGRTTDRAGAVFHVLDEGCEGDIGVYGAGLRAPQEVLAV